MNRQTEHDIHHKIRVRGRGMWQFKSVGQVQRFVTAHAAVSNLFNQDLN